MMCDLLSVSRSGFHDARGRAPAVRIVVNTQIVKRMQCAQRNHRGCYGRRRMTPEMSEELGRPVNHKRRGWAMNDTLPQELTLGALRVALGWRDPDPGRVHHSDRGSQYAANDYRGVLNARGITVSMGRKGDCWDNSPTG